MWASNNLVPRRIFGPKTESNSITETEEVDNVELFMCTSFMLLRGVCVVRDSNCETHT
jgi:hypothetical protein